MSIVPIIMLIVIVAGTNYAGLADKGFAFAALLLVSALFVGFAEESLFRGIGIVTFRINGFTEGKVALWTCIIFGLAHSTNIFTEGPKALLQVLVTAVAGYFFYLIRRRSGGLVVPAVLHGLWDFGLLTASVVPDEKYFGPILFVLADIVLAILVLVRRHHIEPTADASPGAAAAAG